MTTNHAAILSRCKRYRYQLERSWTTRPSRKSSVAFIGLNPSTADACVDDPTIRKCVTYARSWGFTRVVMVNLFAWRATDPKQLLEAADPIGKQNGRYLTEAVSDCSLIIACWGEYGTLLNQSEHLHNRYSRRLYCLKTNRSGEPTHPLYLPATLTPVKLSKARQSLK